MTRRLLALLAAAIAASACGPGVPIVTGLKQAGADVFFGLPSPSPQAQPPPLPLLANPFPNFPTLVEQPPLACFGPTCPPPPCPAASPLAYPGTIAPDVSAQPPKQASYPFRHSGFKTTTPLGGSAVKTPITGNGTRQVTKATPPGPDGSYSFDVVDVFGTQQTTDSFKVYPSGPTPVSAQNQTPAAGVYITAIVTQKTDGSDKNSFTPASPGLEIFPFPAGPNTPFAGAATDPIGGKSEELDPGTQINGRQHVNACGTVLDSWDTTLNGRMLDARGGSAGQVSFTETIDMGTQYGAFILSDHLVDSYTDASGATITDDVTSIINVEPG